MSRDPDYAPFTDDLSSAGWDLLPLTYRPIFLKFLTTHYEDMKSGANWRIRVVWGG